jgi:predicted ATPase
MKLLKLSYTDAEWELRDLELNPVNLIVAKNATGKSRTLQALDTMIKIITQKTNFLDRGGRWSTEFQNDKGEIIKYIFYKKFHEKTLESVVSEERLFVNGKEVLTRTTDNAGILNMVEDKFDDVYPPPYKLVLQTNRDLKKYPFLEDITNWAENSYGLRFANIISTSNLNQTPFELLNPVYDIPELFKFLGEHSRQSVIVQLENIGYTISEITSEFKGDFATLFLKEKGIKNPLPHWQLAQGIYRTLAIIIFFEFLICVKKPEMVIIDDMCEGLDYERATKLGKLIFEKSKDSDIQLIATSNDSFLMDVVDIKYWNVLIRKGKTVTAINYKNNQKAFDDFRFTGLSNFDFFSSDFLKQESK